MTRLLSLLALCALACSDPGAKVPASRRDAARPKRVFEPPPGEVRPAPPFAIRSDGVGPYLVGADLADVLDIVPRGPRIELLKIEGVAEYNLVRAEDEGLVIGSDRSKVGFVAAVAPKLAKTSTGIGVGSTAADLDEALEGPVSATHSATDPMVREFASLPGVRFIVDRDRVVAVVVASRPAHTDPERPEVGECRTGGALAEVVDEIFKAAKVKRLGKTMPQFGCFTGDTPEALVVGDGRVILVAGLPDKLRRVASHRAPELRFAAPLDVDSDGRDEMVLVSIQNRKGGRVARVQLLRADGNKLVVVQSHDAYEVSPRGAAWTGAHVDEVDLLLEVSAGTRHLTLGGLYLHRVKGRAREVAPLVQRTVRLKRDKPKPGKKDKPGSEKDEPGSEKDEPGGDKDKSN